MVCTLKGFEPVAEIDADSLREYYTLGNTYEIEAKKSRSLPQLRQWWGILRWVHFHDRFGYTSSDQINRAILIEQGLTKPERRLDGSIVMVPDSIAFDNMDSKTFSHFMDRGLEIIHAHWGLDIKKMLEEGIRLTIPTRREKSYQKGNPNGRVSPPNGGDRDPEETGSEEAEAA